MPLLDERRRARDRLARRVARQVPGRFPIRHALAQDHADAGVRVRLQAGVRSEEHTSELQSRPHLVCRLLLEKKKLVDALHQPQVSMANNEAAPSTHLYAD